ncbi:hypothetical protein JTE90_003513 [Oedothorax gibbosus]|uniref:Uncharacterized protein n=1 Tax=Oedothorax gibbosus TaxID=931172 RepID=A0AAV6THJ0_9ARAC|nr:hypothetical protein JTE90_003513 [Oedothorax gibbosus]
MFLRFRKKPFHIEGPTTIKGPLYLILPQKYCHKIKYTKTSHSRQTVLDFTTNPALHIGAGEETTRVERTQASRVGHGAQRHSTHTQTAARSYDHNMSPYSPEIISAMEGGRHGGPGPPQKANVREAGPDYKTRAPPFFPRTQTCAPI